MKHTVIEKSAIKAKSEELGIPFSNLLAGYVLEELLYLITDSVFAEFLWLKNSSILGTEQYRKKNCLTLEFVYLTDEWVVRKGTPAPGQKLSLKMGYVMLAYILNEEKVPEIKWKGRAEAKENMVLLDITGEFEEMTVPLHIRVREISGEAMVPVKRELSLFMEKKQSITYLEYPSESILAEQLFTVIKNMELIPEMSAYDQIFQILSTEAVDGRHIRDMLMDLCENEHVPLEKERVQEILSYQSYTYMRKRWEKYLRHRKRKEPSWDEVMEKLAGFLPRIWKFICKDEVFFGDWMPDLGRFLD